MDPLSIAASAAGIAALVGTITESLSHLIVDVSNLDTAVATFQDSMLSFRSVLFNIEKTFSQKPEQHDFERKHWDDIHRILEGANQCVFRISCAMPKPQGKGLTHKAYAQLVTYARGNLVASLKSHIQSYSHCLIVSMTAISIVSQWKTQSSQAEVKLEIQKLRNEIRKVTHMASPCQYALEATELSSVSSIDLTLGEVAVSRNIEKWLGSAEKVAYTMSKYQPDQVSMTDRTLQEAADVRIYNRATELPYGKFNGGDITHLHSSASSLKSEGSHRDSGIDVHSDLESLADLGDPDFNDCLPEDMMTNEIEENQRVTQDKIDAEFYASAVPDQRRVISLYEQRETVYGVPFDNRSEQEEILAKIYYGLGTPKALTSANSILKSLIKQEPKAPSNTSRIALLYHSLALIYDAQGEPVKAKVAALIAFKKRRAMSPDDQATQDTLRLLIKLCRQLDEDATAAALQMQLLPESPSNCSFQEQPAPVQEPVTGDAKVWKWLPDNGYDNVKSIVEGKTPLHRAIKEGDSDIVRALLKEGASKTIEEKDTEGLTALLLAAKTKNSIIVSMLLSEGADVTVLDKWGNSALHCAQSSEGGVQVALLLLTHTTPINVNSPGYISQTPLHYAVRFGNEPMIDHLLKNSANPNAQDDSGSTPLHTAVENRRAKNVVALLLNAGADFTIQNSSGVSPCDAALRMNPAIPETNRLFEQIKRGRVGSFSSQNRRPSETSISSHRLSLASQRTNGSSSTFRKVLSRSSRGS